MASGFGEFIFTSTIATGFTGVSNFTSIGKMTILADNSNLLYTIIALCGFILLLLLFGFLLLCLLLCQRRKGKKQTFSVHTSVLCKATSVSDLNRNLYSTSVNANKDDEVCLLQHNVSSSPDSHINDNERLNNNKHGVQKKQLLVTVSSYAQTEMLPACENEEPVLVSSVSCNSSYNSNNAVAQILVSCDGSCNSSIIQSQSFDEDGDKSTCAENQSHTEAINGTAWITVDTSCISQPEQNGTPEFYSTPCTHIDSGSHEELFPASPSFSSEADETRELLLPEGRLFAESLSGNEDQSPSDISTSLPVDERGHPRAWFVPLNELYHEPLRHSFIDVSSYSLKDFTEKDRSKAVGGYLMPKADSENVTKAKNSDQTSSHGKAGHEADRLEEHHEEYSVSWRDSGIPQSCSNIRSSDSCEFEGKKPSAWELRECRPVLFLEKRNDNVGLAGSLQSPS